MWVEAYFVKMFAHQPEAKTVKRADVRDVEKRELTRPVIIIGRGGGFFLEFTAKTLAQLGGGGLGERDNEQFIE